MKSLTEYVADLNHSYSYKVKVLGEVEADIMEKLKTNLQKFELESCSEVTSTPITEDPVGFPGEKNESVSMFDIVLKYPANSEQVQEEAKLAGIQPAKIRIMTTEWDQSMNDEYNKREDTTRLETPEYPKADKEQTEASTKYSESFKDIVKNAANTDFKIAKKEGGPAKFNTDSEAYDESPFSKETREHPDKIFDI